MTGLAVPEAALLMCNKACNEGGTVNYSRVIKVNRVSVSPLCQDYPGSSVNPVSYICRYNTDRPFTDQEEIIDLPMTNLYSISEPLRLGYKKKKKHEPSKSVVCVKH